MSETAHAVVMSSVRPAAHRCRKAEARAARPAPAAGAGPCSLSLSRLTNALLCVLFISAFPSPWGTQNSPGAFETMTPKEKYSFDLNGCGLPLLPALVAD